MAPAYSTIPVRSDTKQRLSVLKGSKSWDAFLEDLMTHYPVEETIRELEGRLADLRTGRVGGVSWATVKKRSRRRT